jgi:hypothetical protein
MATKKSPAGSLEPINPNKGKWTDGLGALELSTLSALATDINKAVDQTVKQVARGKIKVGKLLLEARAQFVDNDAGFGKWREDNTPIQSKQHAHYLMQVAERFGSATVLIDGANYSVMQELVLAEQKDIEWVTDKIDSGEPLPTVAAVREKVKQTQAERLAPKGTSKKGAASTGKEMYVPNAHINTLINLSLTMRIKQVVERGLKGLEGDLIILGMDPDPQIPCHPECLIAIVECWEARAENDDEMRAVQDSAKRVQEEFAHWGSR